MKISTLLIVSAVVYALFGLAFLLAAGMVLPLYGGMSMEPLSEQLFGAALIGFAVLNWFARNAEPGTGLRAIVIGNVAYNVLSFAAVLLAQLSGTVSAFGWSSVAITLLLTLGFAYLAVTKARASAMA